ncbi:MAG: Asp-tRNA(Asn)/Glu-tRNA(Gln) amidotransferase subunit GatB [Candidatus Paceibacterota bacterium]|jgi:aspartyl-tRNA(Asn)/glutamyl-tRNA(Gln) amidotransferase subunit B
MKYLPTIGLEIHAELKTFSKMFCSCKNDPDEEKPNSNVCPICLGHPGTLPVLNHAAIKKVLMIGTAVGGTHADFTEWDRKNYFYPDIPKGYQISQYKFPLISEGMLAGVELERIHLEEDTAQSTHDTHKNSLINFNRSGVPLMELVTKPVIHDAETAVTFAKELRLLLRYLDAGDANMEKGEMRVEANISVASEADTEAGKFGTKTEVKNLNSFRSVEGAVAYEIERQIALIEAGGKVVQETRGWDDVKRETYLQRVKESSHDYRYFPDPDLPKMKISEIPGFDVKTLENSLPELPWVKRDRYKNNFGMTEKEVAVFVDNPELARYFEEVISPDQNMVKLSTNYILTDYLGALKKAGVTNIGTIPATAFADIIKLISSGDISSRGAKELIAVIIAEPRGRTSPPSPRALAEKHNLIQKSNSADLEPIIDSIIAKHASVVTEYKTGKVTSLQFLIGQVMKESKGSANPGVVKEMLIKKLN